MSTQLLTYMKQCHKLLTIQDYIDRHTLNMKYIKYECFQKYRQHFESHNIITH